MKRLTVIPIAAALAVPATAQAAPAGGVVLSVSRKHHAIQVVDAKHVVHGYRYRGRLPRLHAGSRITFRRAGKVIAHVKSVSNNSRSVSFFARVVKTSHSRIVLRTADGKTVSFSRQQIRSKHKGRAADLQVSSGGVTINILGLEPGATVLITETVGSDGSVTITITLPAPSSTEQHASGVVSEVDDDAFVLETADGQELRLHMSPDALSNLNLSTCDTADVSYHQDAGILVADSVQQTGTSISGDCTPTEDATGTITQVSGQGIAINTDQGPLTFAVTDPDVTDGYQVGDVVDVTYVQNPDGSLTAQDVNYVEQDASGTVTAVSHSSLTITDSDSGQSETFSANPNGVDMQTPGFDGVTVGESVDVTYHQSAGGLVADTVCDQSTDN